MCCNIINNVHARFIYMGTYIIHNCTRVHYYIVADYKYNCQQMATGGGFPRLKQSKSETKQRSSNWPRSVSSDKDDSLSLTSFPSDIRINNWVSQHCTSLSGSHF